MCASVSVFAVLRDCIDSIFDYYYSGCVRVFDCGVPKSITNKSVDGCQRSDSL